MSKKKPNPQYEVDAFNALYSIGQRVRYWPGAREGDGIVSNTRTEAQVLSGHTAVVWVDGASGCISLSHVKPLPPRTVALPKPAARFVARSPTWPVPEILAGIEIRNPPYGLRMFYEPSATGEIKITITLWVPHRETGLTGPVSQSFRFDLAFCDTDPRSFATMVRIHVGDLIRHELDESFLVDGRRLNDPHEGDGR